MSPKREKERGVRKEGEEELLRSQVSRVHPKKNQGEGLVGEA